MSTAASPETTAQSRPAARPNWADLSDTQLMKVRLSDLGLTIEGSWLEARIATILAG